MTSQKAPWEAPIDGAATTPKDAPPAEGGPSAVTRWRTPAQIMADSAARPREYLVPGLLCFGSLVLVIGQAKIAGKTTWTWALAAAAERGAYFLGVPLPTTPSIFLTEEADPDLIARFKRFGLELSKCRICSRSAVRGIPDFEEYVRDAVEHGKAIGARILIVDTFAFWAALEDGAENDAGAVTAALRPLQAAADAGLLVLLVHHPSKREGAQGGVAARGSSALPGTVEATIELRPEGPHDSRQRRLHAETRYAGVRDLVIELVERQGEAPTFEIVGDAAKVKADAEDGKVLAFLRGAGAGRCHETKDVCAGVQGRAGETGKALKRLRTSNRVACIGTGKRGNPYRYAALGTPPPTDEQPIPNAPPSTSHAAPGTSNGVRGDSLSSSPPYLVGGTGKRIRPEDEQGEIPLTHPLPDPVMPSGDQA